MPLAGGACGKLASTLRIRPRPDFRRISTRPANWAAEVITTTDEDLARGLLRVARERNVTQIILGKPAGGGLLNWLRSGRLIRRLMQESGDIDLHVIKAEKALERSEKWRWQPVGRVESQAIRLGRRRRCGGRLAESGSDGYWPGRACRAWFFCCGGVAGAFCRARPGAAGRGIERAGLEFLFPAAAIHVHHFASRRTRILFVTYFVVALVLGQLVARIRAQGEAERRREERSTALYELTRELAEAGSRDEVVWQLVGQVNRVFRARRRSVLPPATSSCPIRTAR